MPFIFLKNMNYKINEIQIYVRHLIERLRQMTHNYEVLGLIPARVKKYLCMFDEEVLG